MTSLLYFICIILVALACRVVMAQEDGENGKIVIRPWQYCEGCKHTVQLYTMLTKDKLKNMQSRAVPSKTTVEANEVAQGICDHVSFFSMQPFMRYSCMKIMDEASQNFLEEFTGHLTVSDLQSKADSFKRKRRICVKHTKACRQEDFQRANVTSSKRTTCRGCRLLAGEIEMLDNVLARNVSLKAILEDDFCSKVGHNFYPYQWLETICDDMVEDRIQDIVSIINIQKGMRATGLTPDKGTADTMCEEFFNCPVSDRGSEL